MIKQFVRGIQNNTEDQRKVAMLRTQQFFFWPVAESSYSLQNAVWPHNATSWLIKNANH